MSAGRGPIKVGCWMVVAAAAVVTGAALADLGEVRKYLVAFGAVWGLIGVGVLFNGLVDRWIGAKR